MTGPVSSVDDVVVTGQRRPAESLSPFPYLEMPVWPAWVTEKDPDHPGAFDPCRLPRHKKDWNRDAAAASATQDMKHVATTEPANAAHGFSAREYGAVLWELPGGAVVRGPVTWGALTFLEASQSENGRAGVELDWSRPAAGAVPIGTVHSHPPGGHVPSGRPGEPIDDYAVLNYTQQLREYYSGVTNGNEARMYIAADNLVGAGEQPVTQINVYDNRNIEEAVTGNYTGPEVNPEGTPCGQQ